MTLRNWLSPLARNEVPGKRSGDVSGVEGNESVTWLMETDSAYETMYTLFAYGVLPAYRSAHPQAPYATLRKYAYRPVAPTAPAVGAYEVTATYSSAAENQDDRDRSILDPTARPAKITVKAKQVMEAYDRDRDGKAITNTAGDPFDPPLERPVTRWVFSVVKNVPEVPLWFLDYEETVNDADFDIKGVTVLKGCAKLSGITISDEMVENGIDFLQLAFEIEAKAAPPATNVRKGSDPTTDYTPSGWTTVLLNQGLRQRTDAGSGVYNLENMVDINGDQLTSPALLDENGEQITNPYETAIFLVWETLDEKDFGVLPVT